MSNAHATQPSTAPAPPVERAIAHLVHWKILDTGWRGRLTDFPTTLLGLLEPEPSHGYELKRRS